tara:strand:- start:209 stop:529 length:321 start_codon:yes stop_codon:yes gene_type:complete
MQEYFTIYNIIFVLLVAFLFIFSYILRNLLLKVEKYEDILENQTKFLETLSETIEKGDQHLKKLDERGVFQSDDEVGEFFTNMKKVQDDINRFSLPTDYAKEKIQS